MKQVQPTKVRSVEAAPPTVPRVNAPTVRRSRKPAVAVDRTESPSENAIRETAYFRYVESGRVDGHDIEHWLYAEAALRPALNASPT